MGSGIYRLWSHLYSCAPLGLTPLGGSSHAGVPWETKLSGDSACPKPCSLWGIKRPTHKQWNMHTNSSDCWAWLWQGEGEMEGGSLGVHLSLSLFMGLIQYLPEAKGWSGHSQLADSQERERNIPAFPAGRVLWGHQVQLLEGSRPNNAYLQSLFRVNGGQAQHHPQTCQPLLSTPEPWGNRANSGMWDRQARRESFHFQTQAEKQIVCHYLVSAEVTKQNYEQAKINLPPDTWTWISSCSIWFIQLIKCHFSFIISR